MKEIEYHLPRQVFVRVHRSFIVNINFVKIIEQARVQLEGREYVPLGDHYKERFLQIMDEHLIKTSRAF